MKKRTCWAAQWHSNNKLDGERKHLITVDCLPKLFCTKRECKNFITEHYGTVEVAE